MSIWTQRIQVALIFTGFLMVFAISAVRASPVSDAQEQLNKAYDSYYDAVSSGGKKTPQEEKELRQKIVDPAMVKLNQAMKQEADEVVRQHADKVSNKTSAPADPGSAPRIVESKPEVTLDGSDIPKEIEFPGKPKPPGSAPSLPSVQPKPAPYLGPYAPPKN